MSFTGRYWKKTELAELLECDVQELRAELRRLGSFQFEEATFGREFVIDSKGTRILHGIAEGKIKRTQQGRLF